MKGDRRPIPNGHGITALESRHLDVWKGGGANGWEPGDRSGFGVAHGEVRSGGCRTAHPDREGGRAGGTRVASEEGTSCLRDIALLQRSAVDGKPAEPD